MITITIYESKELTVRVDYNYVTLSDIKLLCQKFWDYQICIILEKERDLDEKEKCKITYLSLFECLCISALCITYMQYLRHRITC